MCRQSPGPCHKAGATDTCARRLKSFSRTSKEEDKNRLSLLAHNLLLKPTTRRFGQQDTQFKGAQKSRLKCYLCKSTKQKKLTS